MLIEKKDREAFNTAFHRREKLVELLENTQKAMLGEDPQMKAEYKKIEKAVMEEIQTSNRVLQEFERKTVETESGFLRKNKAKRYEEVEASDIPLTELKNG